MICESAVIKKCDAGSWHQQRIFGFGHRKWVNGGCCGEVELGLLRLYTLLQLKFKECLNDSYDAWSSFLYTTCTLFLSIYSTL
jgi:hypothetical protein